MFDLEKIEKLNDLPAGTKAELVDSPNRNGKAALRVNDDDEVRHWEFDTEKAAREAAEQAGLDLSAA